LTAGPAPARVALCGMGGVGKSSLAAAAARHAAVRELYADGVFWVDLPASDALGVLDRIACAFGRDISDLAGLAERRAAVRDALGDRRVLLVLDDAWELEAVEALLPETDRAGVLITTRDLSLATALNGQLVRVPTLPLDGALDLLRGYAGSALVDRDPAASRALAELTGGLPLALELAAQRARTDTALDPEFSLEHLVAELEADGRVLGLGPRSRPVRLVFEASWGRSLDDAGRSLFRWLGLFPPDDLPLGAIAAAAGVDEETAADGMRRLAELSLVKVARRGIFRLHPLLAGFAREKLADVPADQQGLAHGRASDHFATEAEQGLAGREPASIEDLRPALRAHWHAWAAGDAERAERVGTWIGPVSVAGSLRRLGFLPTLVQLRRRALDLARPRGKFAEAWALYWLGDAELDAGLAEGIAHIEKALELAETLAAAGDEDPFLFSRCTFRLGQAYIALGDPDRATLHLQRTFALDTGLFRSNPHAALTLLALGDAERARSDMDGAGRALARYEEALHLARSSGARREEAVAALRVADLHQMVNDHDACAAALDGAATLLLDESATAGASDGPELLSRLARTASNLAFNARGHGRFARVAARAYGAAIEAAHAAGDRVAESRQLYGFANFCEHLFLVEGQDTDFPGAVAAYLLAEQRTAHMEQPPFLNPRVRLESRIRPRLEPAAYEALAARAAAEGEAMVRDAVARLTESPDRSPT
jgi:tetratricopeptide (TPR) repeat protein